MWFGEMGVFRNWRTVKKRTLLVTDRIVVKGDSLSPMTFVRFKVPKRGVLLPNQRNIFLLLFFFFSILPCSCHPRYRFLF
jgi:hypothetical protein